MEWVLTVKAYLVEFKRVTLFGMPGPLFKSHFMSMVLEQLHATTYPE